MLKDARARVRTRVDQDKTIDEILAADTLADYDDWSRAFIITERVTRPRHPE